MSLINQFRNQQRGLAQRPAPAQPTVSQIKLRPANLNLSDNRQPTTLELPEGLALDEVGAAQREAAAIQTQQLLSRPAPPPLQFYPTAYSGAAPEEGEFDKYRQAITAQPPSTPLDNFEDLMPFAGRTDPLGPAFRGTSVSEAPDETPGRIVGDEFNPFRGRWGQLGDGGVGLLTYGINLFGAVGGEVMATIGDLSGLTRTDQEVMSQKSGLSVLADRVRTQGLNGSLIYQALLGRDISFVGTDMLGSPDDDYTRVFGASRLDTQASALFQGAAALQYGLSPDEYRRDVSLFRENQEAFRAARMSAAEEVYAETGGFRGRSRILNFFAPSNDARETEIDRRAHQRLGLDISFEDYQRITAVTTREVATRFIGDFIMPDPADLARVLTRGGLALTAGVPWLNRALRTDISTGEVMRYVNGEFVRTSSSITVRPPEDVFPTDVPRPLPQIGLPPSPERRVLPGTSFDQPRLPQAPNGEPVVIPRFSPDGPTIEVVVVRDAPVSVNRVPVEPPKLADVLPELPTRTIEVPDVPSRAIDTPIGATDLPEPSRGTVLPDAPNPETGLTNVNPQQVVADWQADGLTDIVPEIVESYKAKITAGEVIDPPEVSFMSPDNTFNATPGYDISDGRHRMLAYQQLGYTSLPVRLDADTVAKVEIPVEVPVEAPKASIDVGSTVAIKGSNEFGIVKTFDETSVQVRVPNPDTDNFREWVNNVYKPNVNNPLAAKAEIARLAPEELKDIASTLNIKVERQSQLVDALVGTVRRSAIPRELWSTSRRVSLKDIFSDFAERAEQAKRILGSEDAGAVALMDAIRRVDDDTIDVRTLTRADVDLPVSAPIVARTVVLTDGSVVRTTAEPLQPKFDSSNATMSPANIAFYNMKGPIKGSEFATEQLGRKVLFHANLDDDSFGYIADTFVRTAAKSSEELKSVDAFVVGHGVGHGPAGTWGPSATMTAGYGDASVQFLPESWQGFINRNFNDGEIVNVSSCQSCQNQRPSQLVETQNFVAGAPDLGAGRLQPGVISLKTVGGDKNKYRIVDLGDTWGIGVVRKATLEVAKGLDIVAEVSGTLHDAINKVRDLYPKEFVPGSLTKLTQHFGDYPPFKQGDRLAPTFKDLPDVVVPKSSVVSENIGPSIRPGQYTPGELPALLQQRLRGENVVIEGIPFHRTDTASITKSQMAQRTRMDLASLIPGADGKPVVLPSKAFALRFEQTYRRPHPFAGMANDDVTVRFMHGTSDAGYAPLKVWARSAKDYVEDSVIEQFAAGATTNTGAFVNVSEGRSVFLDLSHESRNAGLIDVADDAQLMESLATLQVLSADISTEYSGYQQLLDIPGALDDVDASKYLSEAAYFFNESADAILKQTDELAEELHQLYKSEPPALRPRPQTEAEFQKFVDTNNTGRFC